MAKSLQVGDWAYSKKANKLILVTKVTSDSIQGRGVNYKRSPPVVSKTVYEFYPKLDQVTKVTKPSDVQETTMKRFSQFIEENLDEANQPSYSSMRNWVFRRLENTNMTSSQMKQEFVKKYGSQNLKSYERAVSEYMD